MSNILFLQQLFLQSQLSGYLLLRFLSSIGFFFVETATVSAKRLCRHLMQGQNFQLKQERMDLSNIFLKNIKREKLRKKNILAVFVRFQGICLCHGIHPRYLSMSLENAVDLQPFQQKR